MKKLVTIGNLLFFSLALHAQSDYFVFIQSDNNQPFYVQADGKTLSSSSIGHLIISGLKDSAYVLNIGFPKNQYPEQSFQLKVNRKDAGYQLKNMGGEGWALFNLQTLQLIKSQQSETKKVSISYGDVKRTDVFSTLMAGLVNDSAVLYTSIAKVEPTKENSKSIVSDSQPLPNEMVGSVTLPKVDSPDATVIIEKKVDSSRAGNIVAIEVPRKDTALAKAEGIPVDTASKMQSASLQQKKDEPGAKPMDSTGTASPAIKVEDSARKEDVIVAQKVPSVESKPASAAPVLDKSAVVEAPPAKPKALIVWLSETKTTAGTELVYFDMSVPDQPDTIKILIPKEESAAEATLSGERKSAEAEKSKSSENKGKVFGRLFGKKDKVSPDKNAESSITVTTVEEKKRQPAVGKETTSSNGPQPAAKVVDSADENTGKKGQSGDFFGKLFGKKDKAPAREEGPSKPEAAKASTVKVSDVETQKQPDTAIARKATAGNTDAEVERLKKAQEQEEKTGTKRLFGRLFGKTSNTKTTSNASGKDGTSSSVKVTTVEPSVKGSGKETADVTVINSDCRQFASNDDVDKLKVRMLVEKDPDAQILEARKTFRGRCFSTEQIKSLSTLFRTDEGKYKLFDAAYPFVSDSRNFKTLSSLLSDQYYINRFRVMVRM